ncbi:MAG: crossover junction endodeoxyribonuclease RuvC [Myxococcaceae bacterium]|nr:crossover junction endodeoxyribonuclease RuvC [Myxococcaceae bacterium]
MRVLGIDPGSRYLGYGVVETGRGAPTHVVHGVVRADPRASLAERLRQIFSELEDVLRVFQPDAVAVEGVFTHKNARSALVLGHARGVALVLAARAGLSVHEYAPSRVKRAVGASGGAGKDAVAKMVRLALKLDPDTQRSDAFDALAVALCHVGTTTTVGVPSGSARRRAPAAFEDRLRPATTRPAASAPEAFSSRLSPAARRAPVGS